MSLLLSVLEMVFPVLFMIILGLICNKKQILTLNALGGLKKLVSSITLPVVLFKAFYTTDYTISSLIMFLLIFSSCSIALFLGFVLNRFLTEYKLMPYLLSGFEVGMLGYSLYGLLAGTEFLPYMATVDLGQVLFVYTVYLTLLNNSSGNKTTLADMLKRMLQNPAFKGVAIGIIVGITGIGKIIISSFVGNIVLKTIDMITLPTSSLILIIVGYELSIRKNLLLPVLKTIIARIVIMFVLLCISSFIIFHIVPFDKKLFMAMILLFSLPAPFIIPLYADVDTEGEYISTTLSINTLITVLIFAGLSIYSII